MKNQAHGQALSARRRIVKIVRIEQFLEGGIIVEVLELLRPLLGLAARDPLALRLSLGRGLGIRLALTERGPEVDALGDRTAAAAGRVADAAVVGDNRQQLWRGGTANQLLDQVVGDLVTAEQDVDALVLQHVIDSRRGAQGIEDDRNIRGLGAEAAAQMAEQRPTSLLQLRR